MIDEIVDHSSVNTSTEVLLGSALYFKALWEDEFSTSSTRCHDFHLLGEASVSVPYMTSGRERHVARFDGFKVLMLPYKRIGHQQASLSFTVFLPDNKDGDGARALLERIVSENSFVERHLPWEEVPVGRFLLPKFKTSYGFEVSNVLRSLSLELPFEIQDPQFVSGIRHKAVVEIDEKGTEAAAAATVEALYGCALHEDEPVDFVADHPFVFVIRENDTATVLFLGLMANPQ